MRQMMQEEAEAVQTGAMRMAEAMNNTGLGQVKSGQDPGEGRDQGLSGLLRGYQGFSGVIRGHQGLLGSIECSDGIEASSCVVEMRRCPGDNHLSLRMITFRCPWR